MGYVEDGEFDYHTIGSRSSVNFSKPVKWVGMRQRFFNTFLVAKNNFSSGKNDWEVPSDEKKIIAQSATDMKVKRSGSPEKLDFNIFYGPADYHLLTKYDLQMGKLINLGQGHLFFCSSFKQVCCITGMGFY